MNLKHNFLGVAVAASLAGVSGVGFAATMGNNGTTAYANGNTIATEALLAGDVDIWTWLAWTPGYGLNEGDLITITLSGALYMEGDVGLWFGGQLVAGNFGTLDSVNGVSTITLRANVNASGTNSGDLFWLSGSSTTSTSALIRVPQGTPAGTVITMSSSATNLASTPIPAGNGSNGIFDVANQVSVAITTKATSVADVTAVDPGTGDNAPRTLFVNESANNLLTDITAGTADTTTLYSAALLTIDVDGPTGNAIEYGYTFMSGDSLRLDFIPSNGSLGAVDTTAGANFIDGVFTAPVTGANGAADGADTPLTVDTTNNKLTVTLTNTHLSNIGGSVTDDVVIKVDGSSAIDERTWNMIATLNLAAEGENQLTEQTSHSWTTNGTVLRAPFFTLAPGYVPRIYMQNASDSPVDYYLDLVTDPLSSPALTWLNPALGSGTIAANSSVLLKMPEIFQGQRGGVVITLTGACSSVSGVFQQRSSVTTDFDSYPLLPSTACVPN